MEPIPEEKRGRSKKYLIIIFFILGVLIILGLIYFFTLFEKAEEAPTCGDDTLWYQCSDVKPYYCEEGMLIEKATFCGCPDILTQEGEYCVSQYQTDPKTISLDYIIRGQKGNIEFTMYGGLMEYISELPTEIRYTGDEQPSLVDFKLRNINEQE